MSSDNSTIKYLSLLWVQYTGLLMQELITKANNELISEVGKTPNFNFKYHSLGIYYLTQPLQLLSSFKWNKTGILLADRIRKLVKKNFSFGRGGVDKN